LHTLYVLMWLVGWGTPTEQMWVALAAYASYVVNALQFLLKFQAAKQTTVTKLSNDAAAMNAQGVLES
jgi:3-vinyl bacteriochlorophyllide hydratase